MKPEKLLHLTLEENGYEGFVTKGSGLSITIVEAMKRYLIDNVKAKGVYIVTVDNCNDKSNYLINDYPVYHCYANSKDDAVKLMKLSKFEYKDKPVCGITKLAK